MKINVTLLLLLPSLALMAQSSAGEAVISVQSGAWNDVSTWDCACIPGAGNEVTMSNGHVIEAATGDTLRAETVSMGVGSNLILPAQSRMEVASVLSSLGQVEGDGVVAFVGDGPHECGPARLGKLVLSSGTTSFTDTVFIQSQLDLGSGNLETSGMLVFEGASGMTSGGGTLTGEVTRRYDWTKTTPYTFQIGSGLSGALTENLLGQTGVVYAKEWVESQTSYLSLVAEDEMGLGAGITSSMPAGNYSFNWQGEAVTEADIEVSAEAANVAWRGWNLLSNPLTSFVDLNQVVQIGPGTQGATYQWVDSLKTYVVQVGGVGLFGHQGILAPGDAFWVIADTSYTLGFDAQMAVSEETFDAQFSQAPEGVLGLELGSATSREQCAVAFSGAADAAYNRTEDAVFGSFWRGRNNLDLYTQTADSVKVMVNQTHEDSQVIPVWIKAGNGEALTVSVAHVPENTCLILQDIETGWSGAVVPGLSYEFESSSSADHHRFDLILGGALTTEVTLASCLSAANGTVEVAGPDLTTAFTLVDSEGAEAGDFSGDQMGGTFSGLSVGVYTVTALTEGCADLSGVLAVEAAGEGQAAFVVEAMPDHIGCYDDHGGVVLEIEGGDAPYSIEWAHGDNGQDIEVQESGLYSAMITDASGCSDSTSVEVLEAPQVEAVMSAVSAVVTLVNGEAQVQFQNESLGATGFQWSFGDGESSAEQDPLHVYSEAGTFNVGLNVWNDYCSDSYQMVVTVEVVSSVGDVTMSDPKLERNSRGWTLNHPTEAFSAEVFDLTGRVVLRAQGSPGAPLALNALSMPAVSLVLWTGLESGRQKTWRVAR
jgi:hypothetical protein